MGSSFFGLFVKSWGRRRRGRESPLRTSKTRYLSGFLCGIKSHPLAYLVNSGGRCRGERFDKMVGVF